jgi:hypothetical protein
MNTQLLSITIDMSYDYDGDAVSYYEIHRKIRERLEGALAELKQEFANAPTSGQVDLKACLTSWKNSDASTVKRESIDKLAGHWLHLSVPFTELMRGWNGHDRYFGTLSRAMRAQYGSIYQEDEDNDQRVAPRLSSGATLETMDEMRGSGLMMTIYAHLKEKFTTFVLEDMDGDYEDGIINSVPDEEGPQPF